jgi:hypothetical protein
MLITQKHDGVPLRISAAITIDLMNPVLDAVEMPVIAASLSKLCRAVGHCPYLYSVAEHSIHAASLAVSDLQPADVVYAVLMHDSGEAFMGDLPSPIKALLPLYRTLEHGLHYAIEDRFGVDLIANQDAISHYDARMKHIEHDVFWKGARSHLLKFWTPQQAELHFLQYADRWGGSIA